MKSKKKFLLLGVGVMGALAMGIGATSTFAWYSATTAGTHVIADPLDKSITASSPTYDAITVNLPVNVEAERQALSSGRSTSLPLELAHWYTADQIAGKRNPSGNEYAATPSGSQVQATAGLYRAYYQAASDASLVYEKIATPTDTTGTHDPYALYVVKVWVAFPAAADVNAESAPAIGSEGYWKSGTTVKWRDSAGVDWTEAEIIAAIDPTGTSNDKTAKFKVEVKTASDRAVFFGVSNAAAVASHPTAHVAADEGFTTAVSLQGIGGTSNKITLGSFGLYVEGVRSSETYATPESSTITANFKVTVQQG